jgi:hypothetical protein
LEDVTGERLSYCEGSSNFALTRPDKRERVTTPSGAITRYAIFIIHY